MSNAEQWAEIAQQNQALLTQALEKLAAAERERDTARATACSLENLVHEARADAERVRAELVETAARGLALELDADGLREVLGLAVARDGHVYPCPAPERPCSSACIAVRAVLDPDRQEAAKDATKKETPCRCGRPVVYLNRRVGAAIEPDPTPYCPACEYAPAATCDCVPEGQG